MRAPRPRTWKAPLAATVLAALLCGAGQVRADMMLTPAGTAAGFQLTTFATGFPYDGATGPLGIAFPSSGGVLVTDYPGNARLFPTTTDGQVATAAPVGWNYGTGNATGLAQVGSNLYMAQQTNGALVQVNANGTFTQLIAGGMPAATGLAVNPANGHIFVSTTALGGAPGVLYEVNPLAKTSSPFLPVALDGMIVSPDGKTLYGATATGVVGFDTLTRAQVFNSGPIPGITDGLTLGLGTLDGKLFVNTNGGQIVEVDLATLAQTIIASGGSRGDFVVAAPDGSLFLTQTDRVLRLSAPPGGSFGPHEPPESPAVSVPEPVSMVAFGLCTFGFLAWRRWQRAV